MARFHQSFRVGAPIEAVRAFHASPAALKALTPPPVIVQLHRFGEMREGMEAEFTLWLGPLPIRWTARHENVGPEGFDDVLVEGPMAAWRHQHRFWEEPDGASRVEDTIDYAHPPGWAGLWTRLMFGALALRGTFFYRQLATRRGVRRLQEDLQNRQVR
ncbi:MAG: cyclase [Myxococcota bacterium]